MALASPGSRRRPYSWHVLEIGHPGRTRGSIAGMCGRCYSVVVVDRSWIASEEVMDMILVSGCLLGRPIRYDGRPKPFAHQVLDRWQAEGRLVPICPELAGGLPVPRPPAEIADGADGTNVLNGCARVIEDTGRDVTSAFMTGAWLALDTARRHGCRFALLTDGSPSCGSTFIHDGGFSGVRHQGDGVTAALLRRHGIRVFAEGQIGDLLAEIEA